MSDEQNSAVFEQAMAQLRNSDLVGAYLTLQTIKGYGDSEIMMAAIVQQLGYTPGDQPEEKQSAAQPQETGEPTTENDLPELTLKVNASGSDMVTLQWNDLQGAVSYTVKRHGTGKEYQPLTTVTETKYNDRKVSGGVRYYYRVAAKMSDGKTVVSNEETITIGNAVQKPTATPTTGQGTGHSTPAQRPTPQPTATPTTGQGTGHSDPAPKPTPQPTQDAGHSSPGRTRGTVLLIIHIGIKSRKEGIR